MSRLAAVCLTLIVALSIVSMPGLAQVSGSQDTRPLSPAQIALFETPHLANVSQPVTLEYSFVETAPQISPIGSRSTSALLIRTEPSSSASTF